MGWISFSMNSDSHGWAVASVFSSLAFLKLKIVAPRLTWSQGFRCADQILSPSPAARLCRKVNHVTTDQYLTDKGRMTSDLSPLLIVNVAAVCMRPAGRPISCCLIKAAAADYPASFSLCWGPMREEEGLDYPAPPSTPPPPPPPPPTSTQHFQWYECLSSCRTKDT